MTVSYLLDAIRLLARFVHFLFVLIVACDLKMYRLLCSESWFRYVQISYVLSGLNL
jgi:hypothetical protein